MRVVLLSLAWRWRTAMFQFIGFYRGGVRSEAARVVDFMGSVSYRPLYYPPLQVHI